MRVVDEVKLRSSDASASPTRTLSSPTARARGGLCSMQGTLIIAFAVFSVDGSDLSVYLKVCLKCVTIYFVLLSRVYSRTNHCMPVSRPLYVVGSVYGGV